MDLRAKELSDILCAISCFPPECSDCVAFCQEGHIDVPCKGDWYKECEYRSDYVESESEDATE